MYNFYHLSKEFRDSSVLLTFLIIISFSFVGLLSQPSLQLYHLHLQVVTLL